MSKDYITKSKVFSKKPPSVREVINTILFVLEKFGVPLEGMTPRRLEKMAMSFLAVANIKSVEDFENAKDQSHLKEYAPKTKDIIKFVNKHFKEKISDGSYDDIRRKDLKILLLADIVLRSSPGSATNDSTRGYVLNPLYANLIRKYKRRNWETVVNEALKDITPIAMRLSAIRNIGKIPVKLPTGVELIFTPGKHNELQKAIIEEFLPRYGFGAEVLYVGDTSNKSLFKNQEQLEKLNFFELSHDELPDIIAYSDVKNWIYLIEAVHTSGPIDQPRLIQLQKLTSKCKCEIVYVTAFLKKEKFRSYAKNIAWETEVWIAENMDHLIHFNGDKFLGPYARSK